MRYAKKKCVLLSAALFFAAAGLFPGISHGETGAKAQLQASIDNILNVLKDPSLKAKDRQEQRREKLRKIAAERFDYRKMTQLSLGRYWKERTEGEKDEFTTLFSALLEDTYMSKIETYTDEKVVFLDERAAKNKAQINTKIITDSVEIPINYRMYQESKGNWMVYDMVIEGVSLIGNYRSQFGQILDNRSYADLVSKLKEK